MLNFDFTKINFKQKLFKEPDNEKKKQLIEELSNKSDELMNNTFISLIAQIQNYMLETSVEIKKELKKEIEIMKDFELEEYKKYIVESLENELYNLKQDVINVLKGIDDKE